MQAVVRGHCENDPGCLQAVDCSLRTVFNAAERSPEALAHFLHLILRVE